MKYSGKLLILLLSLFTFSLYAQEAPAETESPAEEEPMSPERQRIEMEIKTSTLSELAIWCRTLGLSESGTREELSTRLREHFSLPESEQKEDGRKLITIESAQTSEYFSIDVIDEDYARLSGDVRLSLKDGETIHRIRANEILFNRTRNIITANGRVVYEKIDGDVIETFRGENITVNIDTWASVFLDGNTEHMLESDGTAYLFSGSVISRNDEDVTILNNARISGATGEESFWSISASKLWLLPGFDFAIFNAVLKVGEIPVLYIPFLYYPADEIFFHPVIGYRSRVGAFVQTTTYILGQPRMDASEANSLSKIIGNSNDTEKELHGIFLRSMGKRTVDTTEISLRALIDYYVNLGAYLGLELNIPKTGILNPLEFSAGLGFTRTISMVGGSYTPYEPNNYDGTFDWNSSNFFSMSVPFRYMIRFNSSISGKYGGLSWDFPYYSDPFVETDFTNRSESMDFINMIQSGIVDESTTQSERASYQWHVTGNLNPSFPSLAPYISRISISSLSTTLGFKRLEDSGVSSFTPQRFFYAPDKYIIYNFTGTVLGEPVNIRGGQSQNSDASVTETDIFNGIGALIPPWTNEERQSEKIIPDGILTPPVLNQRFEIPGSGNTGFSIDYLLVPAGFTELQFLSENWHTYEDVNWGDVQSILTSFSGRGDVNFNFNHSRGLFTNKVTFSGTGSWSEYSYLNREANEFQTGGSVDESKIEAKRRRQYSQTYYSTSYAYNGTFRPFLEDSIFDQSNLQYNFRGTLVRSRRYVDGDGPELRPQWGTLAKEIISRDIYGLNSHRLSATLAANLMDKQQSLTVRTDLPPLDGRISTNAILRFWISVTNINLLFENPEEENRWIFRPIDFTETLLFGKIGSFEYNMIIDPEQDSEITTIRSTLTLWDFRARFIAGKTQRSIWVPDPGLGGRWEKSGDPVLLPRELTFSYNRNSSNMEIIRNRLNMTLNINSSLSFDLQEHTNSNFQLTLGMIMNIDKFLELRIAARTQNVVVFRYFKNIPGFEDLTSMYDDGPQNNLFTDLFDSFNFFDDSRRRRSGFKMQSLDFTAIHFLGDWTAELTVNMYPYRRAGQNVFEITTDVSFLVQWRPITEIKSNVGFDGRNGSWAVK